MKNRKFKFTGRLQVSGKQFETEVEAAYSETAIAIVEKKYPTFKWVEITESL